MIDANDIIAALPEDIPENERQMLTAFLPMVEPNDLVNLVQDGLRAKAHLDAGDRAGARSIMEPYRETAKAAGLEAMFDAFFADL